MISFDSVTLVPRAISSVTHRSDCDTSVTFCGTKLSLPLIASPMHDVCGGDMAVALKRIGGLGIIHKFQSIEEQTAEFELSRNTPSHSIAYGGSGCAIGVVGDYKERFAALYFAGCRIFCLDTANGANTQVATAVNYIRKTVKLSTLSIGEVGYSADFFPVYIIAGNVASVEGYTYLAKLGVDAVRVGIAGGAVCETKTETGIYVPTLQAVDEIYKKYKSKKDRPAIIADGGIRTPSDMNKAIAVGADVVMCGSALAGTKESPGETFNEDGVLYKLFRGSASFGVQRIANGEEPDYVEGREIRVKYKNGGVAKIIKRFKGGLQSAMSYTNSVTIDEFRQNVCVELL